MEKCEHCEKLEERVAALEKIVAESTESVDFVKGLREGFNEEFSTVGTVNVSAFPSERWIKMSLPDSGSFLTAPYNGYFIFQAISRSSNAYISLDEPDGIATALNAFTVNQNLWIYLPVRKGCSIRVTHQSIQTTNFAFVLSDGNR